MAASPAPRGAGGDTPTTANGPAKRAPPAPVEFPLLVDEKGTYARKHTALQALRAKINEIERRLDDESTPEADRKQLFEQRKRRMEELNADSKHHRDPSEIIATQSRVYNECPTRVLMARIPAPRAAPQFLLFRDMDAAVHYAMERLTLVDDKARNVPFSTACLYPMTEENKACGLFVDTEEEFIKPYEPLRPDMLNYEEHLASAVERERDYARRCLWIATLFRLALMSMYCIDAGEARVWYYTSCTTAKNSFHIYVPVWRFTTPHKLRLLAQHARTIYEMMPETHPCRVALTMDTKMVKAKKKDPTDRCIIDWSVYNDLHRQFRAAFQRKDPSKDNSFVPYDVHLMMRTPFMAHDHVAARIHLEVTFGCMASPPPSDDYERFLYEFGANPNEAAFAKIADTIWRLVDEKYGADVKYTRRPAGDIIITVLTILRAAFSRRHSRKYSIQYARVNEVMEHYKEQRALFEELITARSRFTGVYESRHSVMFGYRAFAFLLATSTLRYCYSRHEPDVFTVTFVPEGRTVDPSTLPIPGKYMLQQVFLRVFEWYTRILECTLPSDHPEVIAMDTSNVELRIRLLIAATHGSNAFLFNAPHVQHEDNTAAAFDAPPRGFNYLAQLHNYTSEVSQSLAIGAPPTRTTPLAPDISKRKFQSIMDLACEPANDGLAKGTPESAPRRMRTSDASSITLCEDTASGSPLTSITTMPGSGVDESSLPAYLQGLPSRVQLWADAFGYGLSFNEPGYRDSIV